MTRLLPWPCVPVADWPTEDRSAFERAMTQAGIFDEGGALAGIPRQSLDSRRRAWGNWLGYCRHHGVECQRSALEAMNRGDLTAYVTDLRRCLRPISVRNSMQDLTKMASALFPGGDHKTLRDLNRAIRRQSSLRTRRTKALCDAATVLNFVKAHLDQPLPPSPTGAQLVRRRNILAVALLLYAPLRIANFAALRIDQEIRRVGDRYQIDVAPEFVKNRRRLTHVIDAWLTPHIDLYLAEVRPALVRSRRPIQQNEWFWINPGGTPVANSNLGRHIAALTETELGVRLTAHMFRSIVATTIATEAPELVGIIKPTLGHSDHRTGELHYNMAGSVDAAVRYQDILDQLSRQETPP